ncbi:MAG: peptide-methionine (S)-S-oxide reductase MsrA [Clostridia bacterium]|nr:peptide-methionine (S)-S-oxide reductase MsrA [Clostridia bacterium]
MQAAIIILAVLAALFLLYVFVLVRPKIKTPDFDGLLCEYAHRGLYSDNIPENSLAAFERALKEGVGVELDIQLSSDGEIFVFHDSNAKRMTGVDKNLCKMTSKEIETLRLSGTDQRIPKFTEVLSLIDGKVPILVELKGENLDTSLCDVAAPVLKEYSGPYIVESFNPFLIGRIKKLLKGVITGQLYTNVCKDQKKYNPITVFLTLMAFNFVSRPDFIAFNKECRKSFPVFLTTRFFRAPKFVWTVRGKEELASVRLLGEHAIFERLSESTVNDPVRSAYFAGGCFWCITPDFKEKSGVISVTAGFSGGDEPNPTYEDVKRQKTGHRETVKIDYDPSSVSFGELFDIFLSKVDPFDSGGQFIDRGRSYTLAVYCLNDEEKTVALSKIANLEKSAGKKAFVSAEPFKSFWEAGEEHQDYYLKHPEEFACELISSGRKKNADPNM